MAEIATAGVVLPPSKLDLRRFERRPEEVLLKRDLLDRQLINVEGARLVRANEIELALSPAPGASSASTPGRAGSCAALLPKPPRRAHRHRRVPRLGGRRAVRRPRADGAPARPPPEARQAHPAQIADLVEAASRREGEEIIQAVGDDDRELEADVFEELDDQHQREFLEDRPDARSPQILARMAPDDAADVLGELDDERREPVLALLPVSHRMAVRALLGYDPAEAGGLMSPDFVLLHARRPRRTRWRARAQRDRRPSCSRRVRERSDGALEGSGPVPTLLRPTRAARLDDVSHDPPRLSPPTPTSRRSRA